APVERADPRGGRRVDHLHHQRGDQGGFFFSSIGGHTSWPRDWSSDVCSSDLGFLNISMSGGPAGRTSFLRAVLGFSVTATWLESARLCSRTLTSSSTWRATNRPWCTLLRPSPK